MARILATALSAVTIFALGIVALQYRAESLADESLSGTEAEAFNLTVEVSTGATEIAGNAIPLLMALVIFVLVVVMLLLTR